jgi:hypothetical protein
MVFIPTRYYLHVLSAEDVLLFVSVAPRRTRSAEGEERTQGFGNVIPVGGGLLTASYDQVNLWKSGPAPGR